ncbi:MAG TPA: nitroreductase family protein [Acidimicrobiia bacterium]|nr:nitroreductase family protein [Acidimicrobiia bacterium]
MAILDPMSRDIYDFVLGLRAIRSYREEPLSEEDLAAILEAARWTGSSKNRQDWSFVVVTDREELQALAECGDFTDPVRRSAATIVIVQEPGGYEFDSGRVAQNIMLAAKAIGVASCPITFHRDDDVRKVLGIPDDRRARYGIALGYPTPDAGPARMGGRKPPEAIVHRERYS